MEEPNNNHKLQTDKREFQIRTAVGMSQIENASPAPSPSASCFPTPHRSVTSLASEQTGSRVMMNRGRTAKPGEEDVVAPVESQMTWMQRRKVDWELASRKSKAKFFGIIVLLILVLALVIAFEVYKKDFERWVQPLTNWLQARKAWSWVLPVVILIVLSFPPLFGHELVFVKFNGKKVAKLNRAIVVGLVYPLGVAIAIVALGTILGEAACFVVFKYAFSGWVNKKREQSDEWEATARVCKGGSWQLILLIRYSVMPGHITNPLFATTGLSFWIYIITVILGLPKQLVLTALGYPNQGNSSGVKIGKVIAFGVLLIISVIATWVIRRRFSREQHKVAIERGHEVPSAKYAGTYAQRASKIPKNAATYEPYQQPAYQAPQQQSAYQPYQQPAYNPQQYAER